MRLIRSRVGAGGACAAARRQTGQHGGQQACGHGEPVQGVAGHGFRVLHVASGFAGGCVRWSGRRRGSLPAEAELRELAEFGSGGVDFRAIHAID